MKEKACWRSGFTVYSPSLSSLSGQQFLPPNTPQLYVWTLERQGVWADRILHPASINMQEQERNFFFVHVVLMTFIHLMSSFELMNFFCEYDNLLHGMWKTVMKTMKVWLSVITVKHTVFFCILAVNQRGVLTCRSMKKEMNYEGVNRVVQRQGQEQNQNQNP